MFHVLTFFKLHGNLLDSLVETSKYILIYHSLADELYTVSFRSLGIDLVLSLLFSCCNPLVQTPVFLTYSGGPRLNESPAAP